MVRRITAILTGMLMLVMATPLAAQRVEGSFSGGYTLSEGISVDDIEVVGLFFDNLNVKSGGSFNLTFGVFIDSNIQVEFLYGRQLSKLTASGVSGTADVSELNVDNYHGNLVYNFGYGDSRVRPFIFGGLGATRYGFGNLLFSGAPGGQISSDTRFSTTWGGGVKFYAGPNVGVRAAARWTPTYITSTDVGIWCDPWYGCWAVGDPDYSHQFELSGGITFKF